MTENERQFFDAVKSCNHDKIMQLINKGVDVNVKDCDGWTALMIATKNNDIETVELLAKNGVCFDLKNNDGETALVIAVRNNAKDAGEFLYINGADIKATDRFGRTPYKIAWGLYASNKSDWFFKKPIGIINENRKRVMYNRFSKFFALKNIGDVINAKEIKDFFREKYGILLCDDEISDFVNVTNKNVNNRIIREIGDSVFLIYPSKTKIQAFFDEFFSNGKSRTKITRIFLYDEFKKKYHTDLDGFDLRPYISRYKYVRTLKNGDYVIIPRKDEVEDFLDGFFLNKSTGTRITMLRISVSFKQKYHVPLDETIFEKYIDSLIKSKKVREVEDDVYVIMPPKDEVEHFLDVFFLNKRAGTEIKRLDISDYIKRLCNAPLDEDVFEKYIARLIKSKKVREVEDDVYVIMPPKDEVEHFLDGFFLNKRAGTEIKRLDISDSIKRLCNAPLDEDVFMEYISRLKKNENVQDVGGDVYVIPPSKDEVEHFLDSFFLNKSAGTEIKRSDINDSFKRLYNIPIDEIVYEQYVNLLIKNKSAQEIGGYVYVIMPPEDEVKHFLDGFFLNQTVGSKIYRQDICCSFKQLYHIDLEEDVLESYFDQYVNDFNNKYNLRILRQKFIFLTCKEYFKNQIEYFFILEKDAVDKFEDVIVVDFNANESRCIQKLFTFEIPQKFSSSEIASVLKILSLINNRLAKRGLVFRQRTNNDNEYVLTCSDETMLAHLLAKFLLDKFLHEPIGYFCSERKITELFEDKYDMRINRSLFQTALDEANERFIDIKISYVPSESNGTKIQSSFKCRDFADDDNVCPICNAVFDKFRDIKWHILREHTTCGVGYSVLARTSERGFYCHHCQRDNLYLYDVIPGGVIGHIKGDCKNGDFFSRRTGGGVSDVANGIWKGTAYSDDSSILGNSGQMYRDGGKFGSFPSEDNYGNGDTNF